MFISWWKHNLAYPKSYYNTNFRLGFCDLGMLKMYAENFPWSPLIWYFKERDSLYFKESYFCSLDFKKDKVEVEDCLDHFGDYNYLLFDSDKDSFSLVMPFNRPLASDEYIDNVEYFSKIYDAEPSSDLLDKFYMPKKCVAHNFENQNFPAKRRRKVSQCLEKNLQKFQSASGCIMM